MSVTYRTHALLTSASLCLLLANPLKALAEVAIGLYNPFNHGFMGVNEIAEDRARVIHRMMFPSLGGLSDTDYRFFSPFYADPATDGFLYASYYNLDNYRSYIEPNPNPGRSPYLNVHITGPASGNSPYFDPIERGVSDGNTRNYTLDSPRVDTGIGTATGSINSLGQISLQVGVKQSGGPEATPVAEGALQGTYRDKFTVNGSGPTAAAKVSFSAHATAPTLDFSKGDFYNYGVGYQLAVYERTTTHIQDEDGNPVGPELPAIKEYWSDSGLYWMDARLKRDPFTNLPDSIHIESLGDAPPGVAGVDYQRQDAEYVDPVFGSCANGLETPTCGGYLYTRDIAIDPADVLHASYDDPMMPFSKTSISGQFVFNPVTGQFVRIGDIELPTGVELELMVNFFVVAGCSDLGFKNCEISIDGSHTAALGIEFTDPTVSMTSQSGFTFPQTVAVPEPGTYAMMLAGLALLGFAVRRAGR